MISVITPTMWKHEGFPQNIAETLEESVVDEYIIINNDVNAKPESEILSHPKIKIYDFSENTYVNPAWNFGASVAKNKILAFLSDDVEFDSKIFPKTYELFQTTENVGIVGVLTRYHDHHATVYDWHYTDGKITFISHFPSSTFGAFFFMLKEQWKPIPSNLKIVNGECLQSNRCVNLNKKNFMVVNCKSLSPWHVTLRTIPQSVIDEESKIYQHINEHTDWTRV